MIDSTDLIEKARAAGAEILRDRPFEALRARPDFGSVMREVTTLWGSHQEEPRERGGRALADVAQFAGAMWIAYLEATPGGLTLQRLDQAMTEVSLGGVGRARAVLTYLSYIRYIEALPRDGDGRYRRYRATPIARRVFKERFRAEFEARRALDPAPPALADRLDEGELFEAFVVAASEAALVLMKGSAEWPNPINVFADRSRGMVVLCHLLAAGEPGDSYPPRGPLAYTVSDLAKRSGSSRMQVNHLLRMARAQDLLVKRADGRETLSAAAILGSELMVASTSLVIIAAARLVLEHAANRAG